MHGVISSSYDKAGDTGRETRVDATWASFSAGAEASSLTAAPALTGLEGLPTSEVHRLCLESFLRQHLLHRVRGSACCEGFEYNLRAL